MIVTVAEDLSSVTAVSDDGYTLRLPSRNPETQAPWASEEEAEAYARASEGRPGFWTAPKTLEEVKAEKKARVSELVAATLAAGYPHDFGEPYGTKILQTRDSDDRTNWLTSAQSYGAAIAAGYGDMPGATFRTADNVNIQLTYSEGYAVLLAMAAWGQTKYSKSWALKDAIDVAEDIATVEGINVEAGW